MITKLKLKNFRQHEDTELIFVPGVNTIVGANNSGKSTIPEAIEFALFGSRALRDNAKGYIRDGCSDGSAIVKLELGKDVLTVGRNTKNAEVRLNGNLEARYKGNVSEYISTATGVSQVGFRLGHYIRQKELSFFSGLRPGKRYELIEKMLKINAVDVAIKLLKQQTNDTNIEMKVLLTKFADVSALQVNLEDLLLGTESEQKKEKSIKSDLHAIKLLLDDQRKELMDLQHIPEYNAILVEIIACELAVTELATLEEELEKLVELDENLYKDLYKKLKELTLEEQARKELTALEVIAKPDKVEQPEVVDRSEYVILAAKLASVHKEYQDMLALDKNSPCPTCGQTLNTEYAKVLETLKYDIKLLEEREEDLVQDLERKDSEYTTQRDKYKEFVKRNNLWAVYVSKLDELLGRCTDAYSVKDKVKINEELACYTETKERRAALKASISGLKKSVLKLPGLKTRETELEYVIDLEEDPELNSFIKKNETIEQDLNIALNKATKELAFLVSSTLTTEEKIKEAIAVGKDLDTLALKLSNLKHMRDSFILFKRYLTSKIRPMLESVASTLFHKTTQNRYAGYELSDDYDISLITHDGYRRKLSSISGSENDLASLCLRLAIATLRSTKLAGSLGFIILDEISGSFDDERTRQTLEGLLELKEVIPQIINITHKPVEMKYADKLFTVTEKNSKAYITH